MDKSIINVSKSNISDLNKINAITSMTNAENLTVDENFSVAVTESDNGTCESNDEELAGPCKDHDRKVNEVCIPQSPTYTCVELLEIFVERRTREAFLVSQFKETCQSTTFDCSSSYICEAAAGVDGIKTPNNMFHTDKESEPFWWVNLGQVYMVQKVVSRNRIDKHGKSLDTSQMELCGQFIGPAINGQVIVTLCNTLPGGQIVKLMSVNTVPERFHLFEVEVYGC
ncbi:unnamed protein product [Mytilus coruscus]|uniref:Fucolectin tachylectin-4 pentraxin-1 domain-containing protein n=1 Tax=Mytilus coruscus TaxID=42192 RepID=A0A6J8CW95_MYTCO|nr:unnamed protein product [Mytilus coruscus]